MGKKRMKMPHNPGYIEYHLIHVPGYINLHDHRPQQHGVTDANLSITSTKESYSVENCDKGEKSS